MYTSHQLPQKLIGYITAIFSLVITLQLCNSAHALLPGDTGIVNQYNQLSAINTFKTGDAVLSFDPTNGTFPTVQIKATNTQYTDELYQIATPNGLVVATAHQAFFDLIRKQFVPACAWTTTHVFIDHLLNSVETTAVTRLQGSHHCHELYLDTHHIFFASPARVMTHNNPLILYYGIQVAIALAEALPEIISILLTVEKIYENAAKNAATAKHFARAAQVDASKIAIAPDRIARTIPVAQKIAKKVATKIASAPAKKAASATIDKALSAAKKSITTTAPAATTPTSFDNREKTSHWAEVTDCVTGNNDNPTPSCGTTTGDEPQLPSCGSTSSTDLPGQDTAPRSQDYTAPSPSCGTSQEPSLEATPSCPSSKSPQLPPLEGSGNNEDGTIACTDQDGDAIEGATDSDGGSSSEAAPQEEDASSIEDIIKNETATGETTSGRTTQFDKIGQVEDARKDFYRTKPTNIKAIQTKSGPGLVGTLSDGRHIIFRPGSSTKKNFPTLEIQNSQYNYWKIRYVP